MTPSPNNKESVIVLSSHVTRGSVGNRAAVLALETMGHPVWAVPTVMLPWHPGHGSSTAIIPPLESFENYLSDLAASKWIGECRAILTGYMASAGQVKLVAEFVKTVKQRQPDVLYLCDPVLGDNGRLYISKAAATQIRKSLLPLADIITPNLYELGWLTDTAPENANDALDAASHYADKTVLVTSIPGMMRGQIGNLLKSENGTLLAEHKHVDGPPNGSGDLTAALFLSNMLHHASAETALQRTTASVFEIIAKSAKNNADELMMEAAAQSIIRPMAMVHIRNLFASQTKKPVGKHDAPAPSHKAKSVIGIDGCPAGWICVQAGLTKEGFSTPRVLVFPDFETMMQEIGKDAIVAVDMPLGLPDCITGSGRGPEQSVRTWLGKRQSSVFSIPSRAAVYEKDYAAACQIALSTSNPPRKISKQAYMIFPKIREIDTWLRSHPGSNVFESHPELALTVLNDNNHMQEPKKIKSRINPDGIKERSNLLSNHGFDPKFLRQPPPKGAAVDDFLDACACMLTARRIALGKARPYPENYQQDAYGIPVAIWA